MLLCSNKDLGNCGRDFLNCGAVASSPLAVLRISIMESPDLLENGNIPQQRKFPCCQVAFYTLIFVLIMISTLVSVVVCLLHHKQALESCWAHGSLKEPSTSSFQDAMSWEWNLQHCDGFVQKDHDQYLIIKQSGNYFIYAQVNRKQNMNESFTVMLYKEPTIPLNKVVGSKMGDGKGTLNFGRPFFLQKGDKLYCRVNFDLDYIVSGNQTYWGLYKL